MPSPSTAARQDKRTAPFALTQDADEAQRHAPIYAVIVDLLRKAIVEGSLEQGTVLLEGHVAEILRSTRSPVRQALRELEADGVVSRFEGRGFVAGPAGTAPRRIPLDPAMLGVDSEPDVARKTLGWEVIYDEVERDLVHLSVFGRYRVNEIELARHFNVGRTVVRDVLLRLESLGILEKDERLRWVITPLDAKRIHDLYELRSLVEPAALRAAIGHANRVEIERMIGDLHKAQRVYPKVSRTAMDNLEHDLHVQLLSQCPNKELLGSLQRTRCILTLSKHVLGVSTPMPEADPFMSEHIAVLQAAADGAPRKAADLLRDHLELSCEKVTRRAELVRETFALPEVSYIA
ncbi:GntR family transcriptional regulator [Cupriavidus basilensis OR16]|uniref:GntR family transcriptional regulator n=1 Tax=Cupriavidus basilensis OR16 TaxID=1127483 RepID=H1S4E7_9BURK|nr:GntR family transcriptional regulator [Cupriavidus basilensis]EHP42630.1 GntR family transcriptional regulator [Cupriavidus basilensis OR16]